MALFAEYVPKHRRKLVGLEREPDVAGAFDDKILGLADFGDARKVSLDVGCENRDAGARKSLSHHLQRHGFSGSGGAGNKAVTISERERQPHRLFALANEDLRISVGQLVVGRRHAIASLRASGVPTPSVAIILHLASRMKPVDACDEARCVGQAAIGRAISRRKL